MKRVGVCGLGKIGSVLLKVFSEVTPTYGYDIDGRGTVEELVTNTDVCIFIVPTPSRDDGTFDNTYLIDAIKKVSEEITRQQRINYIFIVSSTTTPGSCKSFLQYIPQDCALVYKPEFIAQGKIEADLRNPDIVLIGRENGYIGDAVEEVYREINGGTAPVHGMSLTEAELAKIALNCAVTMKISFANQVGLVAQSMGCDPNRILAAVGSDSRIGRAYLHSGLPYGGPCFPRDNRMFRAVAAKHHVYAFLSMASDLVNEEVKERILTHLMAGRTPVGILGLAYKPGTALTEESLGTYLVQKMTDYKREVRAYDTLAPSPNTLEEVLACPIVAICCPDPFYATVDYPATCEVYDPWGLVEGRK